MQRYEVLAQEVKAHVTPLQAGIALGLNPDRNGRCKCPVHNGKDRNCKLTIKGDGNEYFYCFVCHASGDVIELVEAALGVPFIDAVKWLNETFQIGMDVSSPLSAETLRRAKERKEKAIAERERQRRCEWAKFELNLVAMSLIADLETLRDDNIPDSPDAEWNDDFRMAIETLPIAKRLYDTTAMICTEVDSG